MGFTTKGSLSTWHPELGDWHGHLKVGKSQKEYKTKNWETYLMIDVYSQAILRETFVKVCLKTICHHWLLPQKIVLTAWFYCSSAISCRQYGGHTSLEILRTFHYARTIKQVLVWNEEIESGHTATVSQARLTSTVIIFIIKTKKEPAITNTFTIIFTSIITSRHDVREVC